MNEPKISVIVPVYKVEKYLRKCVDSIINQTYKNLEIILVDDGSPDNCGAICDEYAAQDSRVRVIHKENGGVSSARNAGLDVATGEYIGFVDGDDWIKPEMYASMLAAIKKTGAEVAACGYVFYTDEAKQKEICIRWDEDTINGENLMGSVLYSAKRRKRVEIASYVWNKLFLKTFWGDLRFDTGLTIGEDLFVLIQAVLLEGNCAIVNDAFYYYYQNPNGAIGSTDYLKHSVMEIALYERILGLCRKSEKYVQEGIGGLVARSFVCVNYSAAYHDYKQYYAARKVLLNNWNDVSNVIPELETKYGLALRVIKGLPNLFWLFCLFHNRKVKKQIS